MSFDRYFRYPSSRPRFLYFGGIFTYIGYLKLESNHFLFACDIDNNYGQVTFSCANNCYLSYQEIWLRAHKRLKLENESDSEKKATGAELGSKKIWKAVKYSLLGSWYFFLYALVVLSWSLVFIDTSQIPKEYAKDDPERIVWGFSTEGVSSSLAGQSFRFALKERKCADCEIRDYELNTDKFCNVAGTCGWERIPVRQTNGLKEDAAYLHNIPAELCKGAVATIDTYVHNNGERVSRYKVKPIEFAFFDEGKLFIKTDQVVRYGCVKMNKTYSYFYLLSNVTDNSLDRDIYIDSSFKKERIYEK